MIERDFLPPPRRRSGGNLAQLVAVGALLGLSVAILTAAAVAWRLHLHSDAPPGLREAAPRSQPDAEEREAIDLFKNAKASVVNVDTVAYRRGSDRRLQATQTETGSGFFWDDRGRIVTNFHVVRDAFQRPNQLSLRVVLADRSAWPAAIIGTAPEYDLAVIQIDAPADRVKKIALGRSDDLEVGQKAYAIGNPFGLSLSLTKGIISALDREIESPAKRPISGAIQIDAPINPGNSGGPLLDREGRLIGVNTSITTPSGGNVGIGFAIPVDTVNAVATELIQRGRILKPDLGIRLVDQRILRRAGYAAGVMVDEVLPGSPAANAGLQPISVDPRTGDAVPGDWILKWNGREIAGNAQFEQWIAESKPGDKISLEIERRDQRLTMDVVIRGS